MATYDFTDEWRLTADAARAWDLVGRADTWPRWWPSVLAVEQREPPGADGSGAVLRFTFRTRLPYRMSFEARVRRDEAARRVRVGVHGRVAGSGECRVLAADGGCAVAFRWVVTPVPRWMRLLSRPARRVFAWNHASLMAEGARGLARELGVELSAPPASVVSLTRS